MNWTYPLYPVKKGEYKKQMIKAGTRGTNLNAISIVLKTSSVNKTLISKSTPNAF